MSITMNTGDIIACTMVTAGTDMAICLPLAIAAITTMMIDPGAAERPVLR